jgi:hypothetical protein
MRNEGSTHVPSRRHGLLAWLRHKQWWYFEGLDPTQGLYFVFLALEGRPASYVSLKVIDFKNHRRWTADHFGGVRALPGERVHVTAAGAWGHLRFSGQAEHEWEIDVRTPAIAARCVQTPLAAVHQNRLLTRTLDYTITQFVMNTTSGTLWVDGREYAFQGYGYHEHNWGVQPRHSTAHWLHFWMPQTAGVVLNCYYDAGVPHHYTYLWREGNAAYLFSPAQFHFDPEALESPWHIKSPDLDLQVTPLYSHRTRMDLPPVLPYISIDYYELLLQVRGAALVQGTRIEIDGFGKYDHNFNRW